jgi:hypothetical protein
MRRILITLLTAGLPLGLYGQAALPLWTQDAYRERSFPADAWYTGFARDRLKAGADVNKALKALERDAQNQLAEGIMLTVEGSTQVETASEQRTSGGHTAEHSSTLYRQAVKTATQAKTVKTDLKSHYDPAAGMVYAFAAVRRADLAAFYRKQIALELGKVETALAVADQLVAAGKKMSARRKCFEAEKTLENLSLDQRLLAAVDEHAAEEHLQADRANQLVQTVEQKLIDLEQSTFVYVDCRYEYRGYKDDAFSSDPSIICDIVKQALSENECSVVDDAAEADYTLTLSASTTQRSDGAGAAGIITYYANVKGTLYNRLTKKKTVDFSILNDPDAYAAGKSAEDAATKAFKLPALRDKILDKILPKIKN